MPRYGYTRRGYEDMDLGPLDIPINLGNLISEAAEQFAAENGVEHKAWYHGESIWIVFLQSGNMIREVQIAAFPFTRGDGIERLCFLPQAYTFDGDKLKLSPHDDTRAPSVFPLCELRNKSRKDVMHYIQEAWDRAKVIKEDELLYV